MDDDLDTVLKPFRPEHDPDNGVHYLSNPTKRLKEVFEDRLESVDKHIHVIVHPPRELSFIVACVNNPSWHSASSCNLLLLCFISGDDYPSEVFPIKIASTDSVYTMKKAIKEKNNISLQHVGASALKLWRVSIPVDHGSKEYVRKVKFNDEEALSPVEELSRVFLDQPEDEHLHIIVRCPLLNSECVYFVPLHNSKCSTFGV